MRRREFISLIGSAAVSWPLIARAQQQAMPVVGFLNGGSPREFAHLLDAYHVGMKEAGYVEGRNVAIEYRWAEGHYDRLPAMAADLVAQRVAVISAPGSTPAAIAAHAATTTIPVVFAIGVDPVKLGLVASLNRPGGNVTGISFFGYLGAKQLELLHELAPKAEVFAALVNPSNPAATENTADAQQAAARLGVRLIVLNAVSEQDIGAAFAALVQQRAAGLLVGGDNLFTAHLDQLVVLMRQYSVPTIYFSREFAVAGGLMSYGSAARRSCGHSR
jgi:putative tryptophan/tyrosine transport system substrate-binding protein